MGTVSDSVPAGRIAFLFPGQGAQSVGMGGALAEAFPEARRAWDAAGEALGFDLARLCREGPEERLTLTENAQPAILTASLAALAVVRSLGIRPCLAAGHSLGEYGAVVAGGGLDPEPALRLVRLRGELMGKAFPSGTGGMAAVLGLEADVVDEVCREAGGSAQVANYNCPGQTVISGLEPDLERAGGIARARGARRVVPLAVSGPFHSRLMEPVAARFGEELAGAGIRDLAVPVVSNVDARPHTGGRDVAGLLTRQMASPVRWEESMRFLAAEGVAAAVEVGPGRVLAGLLRRIAPGIRVFGTDTPEDVAALRAFVETEGAPA